MIWKLPEGVKPSMLTVRKKEMRPHLETAFLTRIDDEYYELAATDSYIFGRFRVRVEGATEGAPDEVRVPADALKIIERRDVRAFMLYGPESFVRPCGHDTHKMLPMMFEQPEAPRASLPKWPDLTSNHNPTSEAFAFGVNPILLDRLGRGLGATNGVRMEPGASPLRPIKVSVLGQEEREGLIMPIRLNV